MSAAMVDTVAEVGRASAALGIDCDFDRRGTYSLIRSVLADRAATAEQQEAREAGQPVPERVSDPVLGEALLTEACASLHPGKLVRGLARAAEERGAASLYVAMTRPTQRLTLVE